MAKTRIDDPATEQISNSGCCGVETNALTWYQMIQWVLFTTSLSASIIVVFLYWVLLVPTFDFNCDVNTTDADDCLNVFAHTQIIPHLITGVAAVIDLGFSGIPIRLLHVVYPVVGFAVPYGIFSGLYYVAGGVDIFGNPYIYPILDYGSNPGMAIGLIVMATLVVLPAVHLVIFFMFHLRKRAVVITHKYVCPKREDENTGNAETALDSPC